MKKYIRMDEEKKVVSERQVPDDMLPCDDELELEGKLGQVQEVNGSFITPPVVITPEESEIDLILAKATPTNKDITRLVFLLLGRG